MISVESLMIKNIMRAGADISLQKAARQMKDAGVKSLLIQCNDNQLGMLTESDIVQKIVAEGKDYANTQVQAVMTTPIITIDANKSAKDASSLMEQHRIRHLVVTSSGNVVGIISLRDLHTPLQQYEHLSIYDDLTGLHNRRELQRRLKDEVSRCGRYGRVFTLCMLDIDHFKAINDTHGHQIGDEVLRTMGRRISKMVRTSDFVARYGGEEFMFILTETTGKSGLEVADRMRSSIAAHPVSIAQNKKIDVTVSIGVSVFPIDSKTEEGIVEEADKALYAAKNAGRNTVSGFSNS